MTICKTSVPAAVLSAHEGPLGCYIDLFTQHLREQQFSLESVRAQVLQVADLSRWLGAAKLKAGKLTATTIDAYCREQQAGPRLRQGYRCVFRALLTADSV